MGCSNPPQHWNGVGSTGARPLWSGCVQHPAGCGLLGVAVWGRVGGEIQCQTAVPPGLQRVGGRVGGCSSDRAVQAHSRCREPWGNAASAHLWAVWAGGSERLVAATKPIPPHPPPACLLLCWESTRDTAQPCQQQQEEEKPQTQSFFQQRTQALTLPWRRVELQQPLSLSPAQGCKQGLEQSTKSSNHTRLSSQAAMLRARISSTNQKAPIPCAIPPTSAEQCRGAAASPPGQRGAWQGSVLAARNRSTYLAHTMR